MTHPNITVKIDGEGGFRFVEVRVPVNDATEDLTVWWMMKSALDLWAQTPKMHEYGGRADSGSTDLAVMGDAIATLNGWHGAVATAVALELSVWFYVLGKVSRLISDYQQQRPGKADTWHDVTVYSMMARRIQEVGRWP